MIRPAESTRAGDEPRTPGTAGRLEPGGRIPSATARIVPPRRTSPWPTSPEAMAIRAQDPPASDQFRSRSGDRAGRLGNQTSSAHVESIAGSSDAIVSPDRILLVGHRAQVIPRALPPRPWRSLRGGRVWPFPVQGARLWSRLAGGLDRREVFQSDGSRVERDSTGKGLSHLGHTPISAPRSETRSRPQVRGRKALAFFSRLR